jgi:hypothetical protein
MRKVTPYKSVNAALKSIDNGGRFYNLLTKADDGVITSAELAKAAGVHGNSPKMHLYLQMSLCELPDQAAVTSALSPTLSASFKQHQPLTINAVDGKNPELIGKSAIITGIPKYTTSNTQFTGFIMVPMMTNNVMTMMMIPIMEKYDVYEIRDANNGEDFLIAHTRSKNKLPEASTRLGGFLKEIKQQKNSPQSGVFLEACYYSPLSPNAQQ